MKTITLHLTEHQFNNLKCAVLAEIGRLRSDLDAPYSGWDKSVLNSKTKGLHSYLDTLAAIDGPSPSYEKMKEMYPL
jgi:hypothetical protein